MDSNDWLQVILRFDWSNKHFQKQFKAKLRTDLNCMPSYFYGTIWKKLVHSQRNGSVLSMLEYQDLLTETTFKFESEIRRDIHRTFPQLKFFREANSIGQQELFKVLKAVSIQNPEVGYCQGMGFIAGILLSHMCELDAFNVLSVLMDGEMGGLYKPGLPLLPKYLSQLSGMIESEIPNLFAHFQQVGIDVSMFGSQWVLSLFIYSLSFPKAVTLFNLFLIYRMNVVLLFGVFVLKRMEAALMKIQFEEILTRINSLDAPDMNQFMQWLEDEGGWNAAERRSVRPEDDETRS